jgi:riboflavin biosynthesis pyrimidine reductase
VVGGPTVNTAFAQRHLLDRVVLDIEAVVIGEGLPLFAVSTFDVPLRFREIKTLSPNVIQLHYDVISSV